MALTYVDDAEAARAVVGKIEALGRRGLALRADAGARSGPPGRWRRPYGASAGSTSW